MIVRALLCASAAAACVLGATGCGVFVTGDFGGVTWSPDATIVAVADRLELLDRNGAVVPVLKADAAQTIDILLTHARVDAGQNWRTAPIDAVLEWKHDLATSDGVVLRNVPLARFQKGDALTATLERGAVTGDFDFDFVTSLPSTDALKGKGLGSKIQITIGKESLSASPHGGSLGCDIEVQRLREAGQGGDVAVGTVDLNFSTSLGPERMTESNIGVAAPVLHCAQELGPERAGQCRDVAAEPVIDETGVVAP